MSRVLRGARVTLSVNIADMVPLIWLVCHRCKWWCCRDLFKSLDTDESNTIEACELADGLKAQGYNISQQELAQLMGRVDFDRNGTLDIEEFISGLIDWTEVPRLRLHSTMCV